MTKKLQVFEEGIPEDFEAPTSAPSTPEQASQWQQENRDWWNTHPMRYDWTEKLSVPEFSEDYFAEIDRRFLKSVREAHPWTKIPFDDYIDFEWIGDKAVLEIGVGCGTHAQLLVERAGSYTGIDLTDYAIAATRARLRRFGREDCIRQMDAERLEFDDESFDFVWSWGVIHHSSDTGKVLREIWRVLKPGGRCTVMVYHTSPWNNIVRGALYYGVIHGGFLRGRSVHQLLQETTDGALARYYTQDEWIAEIAGFFEMSRFSVIGHKTQILPMPTGRVKEWVGRLIPDEFGRWLTNRPFFGYMLVAEMTKRAR